jgi:Ni2+-binding GTPase involved in maturation of urease and hydrogenase
MKIHLLSGFLGSGKTTAIRSACRLLLERGIRTAVITNDQGVRLVDADLFKHLGIPGRQVMNGCFCCNYQDLDQQIRSLKISEAPQVIFAESVGSCTDIIATVLKPLHKFRQDEQVTLSVFADALLLHMLLVDEDILFEEAVNYIYFKQLEEAGMLVVNKTDLLNPEQLADLQEILTARYGSKKLIYQNSLDHAHVRHWMDMLEEAPAAGFRSVEMDYDLYGEGEASLAWLDQEIAINSNTYTANDVAKDLIMQIHHKIVSSKYPVGHLKFLLNGKDKISFTSTSAAREPVFKGAPSRSASILLNARVQTTPAMLSRLVEDCIQALNGRPGINIETRSVSAFQPGYPRPAHRFG